MHPAALTFYAANLSHLEPRTVLEFGACNVNGSARDVYHQALSWYGIDTAHGKGVDEVADAATWSSDDRFDIVVCAEVFEHTPSWRDIINNAHTHLRPGGMFLASCATADRPEHSAVDGGLLRPGEFYRNVSHTEMVEHLASMDWATYLATVVDGHFGNDDLQVVAVR